jgi:hypothetical protein
MPQLFTHLPQLHVCVDPLNLLKMAGLLLIAVVFFAQEGREFGN